MSDNFSKRAAKLAAQYLIKLKQARYEAEDSARESEGLTEDDHNKAKERAGDTAISRPKKLSTPMKYLQSKGVFDRLRPNARVLDYGAGRGVDARILAEEYPDTEVVMYDPNHAPQAPKGKFDLIVCNYVLNVISDQGIRAKVIDTIYDLLKPNGIAYISVRGDKEALKGMTSKGTWQGLIKLLLPIEKHQSGAFTMYRMTRDDLDQLRQEKAAQRLKKN